MNAIVPIDDYDRLDADVFLRPGDGIELDGKLYIAQSKTTKPAGYIFADPAMPGIEHPIANRSIKDWYNRNRLRFVMAGEHRLPLGKQQSLRRTLRSFSEADRSEMFRRARYCRAVDAQGPGFSRTKANLEPICAEIAALRKDVRAPDWTTLNRWWNDWDRAGRDLRVLCPSIKNRGNGQPRLEPYMIKAMEIGVQNWLRGGRPKMSTHYIDVVSECKKHLGGADKVKAMLEADPGVWLWPSYKTFTLACRREDRAKVLANREGPKAARHEMFPVGEGHDVRLPFQRVEADFKYLRVFVVDDESGAPLGTPYLMAGVDYLTGMVAGFDIGFDPPSYASAARCLRHIVSHKDELAKMPLGEDGRPVIKNSWPVNGVPRTFVLDNDAAYHSESFRRSAQAIGCHIDFVPPGRPWEKGKIERFWGTVQTTFLDMFPGNVLHLSQKPPENYDPRKDAVITLSQLRLFITKAVVDVHHIGLEPDTYQRRIDLWNEAVSINPPRPVRDHDSIIELVGAYDNRLAERRGIRIFGLRYNSEELALYRSGFEKDPRVDIRYDPQNIGELLIIDPKLEKPLRVPCTRLDYARGLSLHQHKVIQRRAKEAAGYGRLRMVELLLAKSELHELGMSMIKGKKSRRVTSRVAQFLGIGQQLLSEMKHHRDDEDSDTHVELEDDVEDPIDEAQARLDEAKLTRHGEDAPGVAEPAEPRRTSGNSAGAQASKQADRPTPTAPPPPRKPTKPMKVSYD